jgi:hypothetical protein
MGMLWGMMLLVTVWTTGCGGINASVPVSTLMLLQNDQAPSVTVISTGPQLAVNGTSIAGL